jgi:Lon protease-like protein
MTVMPMFPLGSVLFPAMPTALRVFEERYLTMLSTILGDEPPEFGIVLIERGSEVGGGEHRFPVGTVAQIVHVEAGEGFIAVIAEGQRRVEVTAWLDDDPFPCAEVRELDELQWSDDLQPLFDRTEQLVRRTIARASEFIEQQWSADFELSDDRVQAAWQLAGICPLGPLDQVQLLRSGTLADLLAATIEAAESAAEFLTVDWDDDALPD